MFQPQTPPVSVPATVYNFQGQARRQTAWEKKNAVLKETWRPNQCPKWEIHQKKITHKLWLK